MCLCCGSLYVCKILCNNKKYLNKPKLCQMENKEPKCNDSINKYILIFVIAILLSIYNLLGIVLTSLCIIVFLQ